MLGSAHKEFFPGGNVHLAVHLAAWTIFAGSRTIAIHAEVRAGVRLRLNRDRPVGLQQKKDQKHNFKN